MTKRKRRKRDYCDCDPGCCDLPCDLFSLSSVLRLSAGLARAPHGAGERAVTTAIRGYRRVSPRLPTRCRYTPTCSAYALEAISRHGLGPGLRLSAGRLARCRPGVPLGSADPVP